jgi:hypothetical protein
MTALNDRPGAGITWSLVEDGFHVGSRDGEFLGYIERTTEGLFAAFTLYSQPAGTFDELATAMRILAAQERTPVPHRAGEGRA